jgi:hypothetical protein
MIMYYVWKRCRLAGYIEAYSDTEALRKARARFGEELFVERAEWSRTTSDVSHSLSQPRM